MKYISLCVVFALLLTPVFWSVASAGEISSIGGGIASSQSGAGSGYASRESSAGHSASAEVCYSREIQSDGKFDLSTGGSDSSGDGKVTANVKATRVRVSGELDEGLQDGSFVLAEGRVSATGDETGTGGIFVETLVESLAVLLLKEDSRGWASASAEGRATATGAMPGIGRVTAESNGKTAAAVSSSGNIHENLQSVSRGSVYGRAELGEQGAVFHGESAVRSEVNLDKESGGSATASGSARMTADSPFLRAQGSASGSSSAHGSQSWEGSLGILSEVANYLNLDTNRNVYSGISRSFSQSNSHSLSDDYSCKGEGNANGKALGSASLKNGGSPSSLATSADGYSWSGVMQGAKGNATATGEVRASSIIDAAGHADSYESHHFGPPGFNTISEFDFDSAIVDASRVGGQVELGNGDVYSFLSGGSYASGSSQTTTRYLLQYSATTARGRAWAGGDSLATSQANVRGEILALNAVSGRIQDNEGKDFTSHIFSVSSNRAFTGLDTSGDVAASAWANGKTASDTTFTSGTKIARGKTAAEGMAYGSGSLFSAELTGIATAGPAGESEFISPEKVRDFAAADSAARASMETWDASGLSAGVSGSAGASSDLNAAAGRITAETKISGQADLTSSSAKCGGVMAAFLESSVRSYFTGDGRQTRVMSRLDGSGIVDGLSIDEGMGSHSVSFPKFTAEATGRARDTSTGSSIQSSSSIGGGGSVKVATRNATESRASARTHLETSLQRTLVTREEHAGIDAYYQVFTDGNDGAEQVAGADLRNVKFSSTVRGVSDFVSLTQAGGSGKATLDSYRELGQVTFPEKTASISGSRGFGSQQQRERDVNLTANPNYAYGWWSAAADSRVNPPPVIVPPQP